MLLATKLVNGLESRGHRIDVAKTIYFRRRKGTLAILEEIAANITGWDARVEEFVHQLGRTRHNLDPVIEVPVEPASTPAQVFATGNSLMTAFNFTLAPTPVEPGTVQVFAAGIQSGADNNSGVISGSGVAGMVNYATGLTTLTLAAAPAAGKTVAIFYEYPVGGDRSVQFVEGLAGAATNNFIGGWSICAMSTAPHRSTRNSPRQSDSRVPPTRLSANSITQPIFAAALARSDGTTFPSQAFSFGAC